MFVLFRIMADSSNRIDEHELISNSSELPTSIRVKFSDDHESLSRTKTGSVTSDDSSMTSRKGLLREYTIYFEFQIRTKSISSRTKLVFVVVLLSNCSFICATLIVRTIEGKCQIQFYAFHLFLSLYRMCVCVL